MDFLQRYFIKPIKDHYVDFEGVATRREFWYFTLIYIALSFGINILGGFFVFIPAAISPELGFLMAGLLNIVFLIVSLGLFLPTLAIALRRIRDAGYNPLLILIGLIPFGIFALIYFLVQPSKVEGNEFRKN